MKSNYSLDVNLNDTVVDSNSQGHIPYRVIDNMELYVGVYGGYYRLRVSLTEENREALNAKNFNKFKRHYNYELITGDNRDIVAKGQVLRCISYQSVLNRRVARAHNLHLIVNELMHEAIGSLVLSNIEQYDSSSHEMKFFDAARELTPYTSGAGKSGPINSPRFLMYVRNDVDGLHAHRRFCTERTMDGDTCITGIYTTWTYGASALDAPKIMYHDQVNVIQEAYDPDAFVMQQNRKPIPPKICKPATAAEVLEQFKKVVVPTIE